MDLSMSIKDIKATLTDDVATIVIHAMLVTGDTRPRKMLLTEPNCFNSSGSERFELPGGEVYGDGPLKGAIIGLVYKQTNVKVHPDFIQGPVYHTHTTKAEASGREKEGSLTCHLYCLVNPLPAVEFPRTRSNFLASTEVLRATNMNGYEKEVAMAALNGRASLRDRLAAPAQVNRQILKARASTIPRCGPDGPRSIEELLEMRSRVPSPAEEPEVQPTDPDKPNYSVRIGSSTGCKVDWAAARN